MDGTFVPSILITWPKPLVQFCLLLYIKTYFSVCLLLVKRLYSTFKLFLCTSYWGYVWNHSCDIIIAGFWVEMTILKKIRSPRKFLVWSIQSKNTLSCLTPMFFFYSSPQETICDVNHWNDRRNFLPKTKFYPQMLTRCLKSWKGGVRDFRFWTSHGELWLWIWAPHTNPPLHQDQNCNFSWRTLILDLSTSKLLFPLPKRIGTSHENLEQCGTVDTTLHTGRLPSRSFTFTLLVCFVGCGIVIYVTHLKVNILWELIHEALPLK